MQNIDNLIFDLGGVILTLDMPRAEERFTALGVKNYNELFRGGNVSSFFKDYEVGSINNEEFLASLKSLAGLPLSDDDRSSVTHLSKYLMRSRIKLKESDYWGREPFTPM